MVKEAVSSGLQDEALVSVAQNSHVSVFQKAVDNHSRGHVVQGGLANRWCW